MNRNRPRTRIQQRNISAILEAALDVFAKYGYRGSTLDQIAQASGLSKPNLLYYFPSKEAIHGTLLTNLLDNWLAPLHDLDPEGDPQKEILDYVRRKLEMSRNYPRESRLFANEILQGAPRLHSFIKGDLKTLVDEKAAVISAWTESGKIAKVHPYHLLFSIWSLTQHYADFDVQVRMILGGEEVNAFPDAEVYLETMFSKLLAP